jgi:hypothetical protein
MHCDIVTIIMNIRHSEESKLFLSCQMESQRISRYNALKVKGNVHSLLDKVQDDALKLITVEPGELMM